MIFDLPIIDAHVMLGKENHLALDAGDLLREMDTHGVETAIARPMGPGLVVDNCAGNDLVLAAAPRIRGMVSVNPWYGARACEELKRCRDLGAVGLFLHPARQGFMPVEPVAGPVIELAAGFGWPIMFHTGTYIYSDVLAVREVARRYPETKFIAGFGGFTDMWFELPAAFREVANLVLDLSLMWGKAVQQIVNELGESRVLFASAQPRNRYHAVFACLQRLEFSPAQLGAILSENGRRIFKL